MFGGDGAAKGLHAVVHHAVDSGLVGEEGFEVFEVVDSAAADEVLADVLHGPVEDGDGPAALEDAFGARIDEGRFAEARSVSDLKALVDAGFANQLMLSNDWSLAMSIIPTALDQPRNANNPDGILFAIRKGLPALKRIGVSDQSIRQMTVDAPKRFFDGPAT